MKATQQPNVPPSLLLIDDDEDDVFIFREILQEINPGIKLHHANNGLEAIRYLSLMETQQPNLIITDLNMPIMSGMEFLKQIKSSSLFKEIPVFVLSTQNDPDTKTKVLELGAMDFFMKPPSVVRIKNIFEHERLSIGM